MDTESLRIYYKPKAIKLLFIGESPPASGKFFYERSLMTTYTSRAFESAFKTSFVNTKAFLDFFKTKGCYLEDLTVTPVNRMPKTDREKTLELGVKSLSKKLIEYQPMAILIVLKRIERYVINAIKMDGLSCPIHTLPFPGNSYQNKFKQELITILEKYYGDEIYLD